MYPAAVDTMSEKKSPIIPGTSPTFEKKSKTFWTPVSTSSTAPSIPLWKNSTIDSQMPVTRSTSHSQAFVKNSMIDSHMPVMRPTTQSTPAWKPSEIDSHKPVTISTSHSQASVNSSLIQSQASASFSTIQSHAAAVAAAMSSQYTMIRMITAIRSRMPTTIQVIGDAHKAAENSALAAAAALNNPAKSLRGPRNI